MGEEREGYHSCNSASGLADKRVRITRPQGQRKEKGEGMR